MAQETGGNAWGTGGTPAGGDWILRLPTAAAVLRPTGEFVSCNDAALELLGTPAKVPDRLSRRGVPWFDRLLEHLAARGQHRTVITRRRGGERRVLEVRAAVLEQDEILVLLAECAAGATRVAGGQPLNHFLQRLPVAVVVAQDGCVVSANPAAAALYGASIAELRNRLLTELVPLEAVTLCRDARSDGGVVSTFHRPAPDGSDKLLEVTGFTARYRGRSALFLVLRDLTERQHTREQLRRSEEQLRHSQKLDAVGRLAAGVAHDFNNVLTAIHGHVQFLLEDLPEDGTARADALEIRRAADRATDLTRQLLTFARKQPSVPRELTLNGVVAGVEKLLRRLIRPGISLHAVLEPGLPPVWADAGQLEQVLVNLVVNARDAVGPEPGSVVLRTSLMELTEAYEARDLVLSPGSYVVLSVTDNGCGMSQGVCRHVFEPFFTTKEEGTGLGLATVYGIVRQAGGHIMVYSEEDVGTTFRIFLPAMGRGVADRSPHVAPAATEPIGGRILIVDDDDAVRELTRRTLERSGCEVVEAADGAQAMAAAGRTSRFDVVVTDLMLPGLRGDELARRFADTQPEAAVILTSGFAEESLFVDENLRRHAGFLEKPFTPEALVDAVRRAVAE